MLHGYGKCNNELKFTILQVYHQPVNCAYVKLITTLPRLLLTFKIVHKMNFICISMDFISTANLIKDYCKVWVKKPTIRYLIMMFLL